MTTENIVNEFEKYLKNLIANEKSEIEIDRSMVSDEISDAVTNYFSYDFDPSEHISDWVVSRATKDYIDDNRDVIHDAVSDVLDANMIGSALTKFFSTEDGRKTIITAIKEAIQ